MKYNAEWAKKRITKYIVQDEQTFSLSENKKFESCVQYCLNPQFKSHSRNTTTNIIYKTFKKDKQNIMRMFFSLLCKASLTCDVWTNLNNFPYLCLTAHWIDIEWILQKRLIAFRAFDHPHTSKAIVNMLE